jgi:hypothetical protein
MIFFNDSGRFCLPEPGKHDLVLKLEGKVVKFLKRTTFSSQHDILVIYFLRMQKPII